MATSNLDPYLIPAMEAPSGLHSNLINPPSTGYSTVVICVLVIVLSTPFVGLRWFTRKYINHQVWWDDCSCSHYAVRLHSFSILMDYDRVLRPGLDL